MYHFMIVLQIIIYFRITELLYRDIIVILDHVSNIILYPELLYDSHP